MKTRKEIENSELRKDILSLEVLLDIRELLQKMSISSKNGAKKRGRPRKIKP
jgi:hypothetical protein